MSVWWCDECQVPLLTGKCERCGSHYAKPFAKDVVPVFKEEMALLIGKLGFPKLLRQPEDFMLWSGHGHYYYLGTKVASVEYASSGAPRLVFHNKDILKENRARHRPETLPITIADANKSHLSLITRENQEFIEESLKRFSDHMPVVPFSGGKDSLVVSYLALQLIPSTELLHAFGDTGIESPDTYAYIDSFTRRNIKIPFIRAVPNVDFYEMCRLLGPPSRIKRWCCSTQKSFPLGTLYNALSTKQPVVSLCGVRRAESSRRTNHERVLTNTKIADEIMICPIINWIDLEVWSIIITHGLHFNDAYRKGYRRIGCIHCPFNSKWSDALKAEYYPEENLIWDNLVNDYYESRVVSDTDIPGSKRWKARAGGLRRQDDRCDFNVLPCTKDASSFAVRLDRAIPDFFWDYMRPFGDVVVFYDDGLMSQAVVYAPDKTSVFDVKLSRPRNLISITLHKEKYQRLLQQRIIRQVRKASACVGCGVCQITCPTSAISVGAGFYRVDAEKCTHCLGCVSNIDRGCVAAHATEVSGKR